MKRGVPPTARNARTGELTPPGVTRGARSNSAADCVVGHSAFAIHPGHSPASPADHESGPGGSSV